MRKLLFITLITLSSAGYGASFDCAKASTKQEKLICSTPELNDADSKMGEIYSSTSKAFPILGFIQSTQRDWLASYRSCSDAATCLRYVKERISELSTLKDASVYADYVGNKFEADSGTVIIYEKSGTKFAKFFGNWMPDGNLDPDKMKGYPKDGYICNEDIPLVKKGSFYIAKEGSVSDDFSLSIDASRVLMKGHVFCNARCEFGDGVYKKK